MQLEESQERAEDTRLAELSLWVASELNLDKAEMIPVSGDASFRRYFRFQTVQKSYIAMDAPPEKEDSHSFVAIAQSWFRQGIQVPELISIDLKQGFLLLSDFGDDLLLSHLQPECPDVEQGNLYYSKAIESLSKIQGLDGPESYQIPPYDSALLQREMALFPDWLLKKKLALTLTEAEEVMLSSVFELLEKRALAQSQVLVHRDYHARNLMVLEDNQLGIIDFQDAVIGPITYDLVSLLRDCYIVWPDDAVSKWARQFYDAVQIGSSFEDFKKDFDFMGLQRHLKASGIFARLSIRDGKHGYLEDIPRTVEYLYRVSRHYEELVEFTDFLSRRVQPLLTDASLSANYVAEGC